MRLRMMQPIHGWRAFCGEVGVIVLGVLIALVAQQVAQNFGDRQAADSALAAIRAEVADHDFAATEIEIVAPCVLAQLDQLQQRLMSGNGTPAPIYSENRFSGPYVIRLPDRVWSSATWNAIGNDGVLHRLEPKKSAVLSTNYAQIEEQRSMNIKATESQTALKALSVVIPSDESTRLRYLDTIERLRAEVGSLDLVAGQIRDGLKAADMLLDERAMQGNLATSGTIKFCRAHKLPLGPVRPADPANL